MHRIEFAVASSARTHMPHISDAKYLYWVDAVWLHVDLHPHRIIIIMKINSSFFLLLFRCDCFECATAWMHTMCTIGFDASSSERTQQTMKSQWILIRAKKNESATGDKSTDQNENTQCVLQTCVVHSSTITMCFAVAEEKWNSVAKMTKRDFRSEKSVIFGAASELTAAISCETNQKTVATTFSVAIISRLMASQLSFKRIYWLPNVWAHFVSVYVCCRWIRRFNWIIGLWSTNHRYCNTSRKFVDSAGSNRRANLQCAVMMMWDKYATSGSGIWQRITIGICVIFIYIKCASPPPFAQTSDESNTNFAILYRCAAGRERETEINHLLAR